MSLEVEDVNSSSCDAIDEKEVTNGADIAIVHSSLLDGAQPNDV